MNGLIEREDLVRDYLQYNILPVTNPIRGGILKNKESIVYQSNRDICAVHEQTVKDEGCEAEVD